MIRLFKDVLVLLVWASIAGALIADPSAGPSGEAMKVVHMQELGYELGLKLQAREYDAVAEVLASYRDQQSVTVDGADVYTLLVHELAGHEQLGGVLEAWCDEFEEEPVAHTVYGAWLVAAAWRERGGGWAHSVSSEGWDGFRRNLELAELRFAQAYSLNPGAYVACKEMITVKMGQSDSVARGLWFERAIEINPSYLAAYVAQAWALYPRWGGSEAEVLEFIERARAADPILAWLKIYWLNTERDLAVKDVKSEEAQELRDLYRGLHEHLPNSAVVYRSESEAYMDWRQYAEACELSEKAVELDGSALNNYRHAWNLLGYKKRKPEAVPFALRATELVPSHAEYWRLLGVGYRSAKPRKMDEAMDAMDRAVGLSQTAFIVWWRGDTAMAMKDRQSALEDFKTCLSIDPNYSWAYYSMGQAYHVLGQSKLSELAFRRTVATQSDGTDFTKLIKRFKGRHQKQVVASDVDG
jgi:tetratricopeptide (TPR) repeat protein